MSIPDKYLESVLIAVELRLEGLKRSGGMSLLVQAQMSHLLEVSIEIRQYLRIQL